MRRVLILLFFIIFAASVVVHAQNTVQSTVLLAPTNPQFTTVDPFANGLTPANALKPPRPFWYSVDKYGLTIIGLRTEKTGALMVGGPPIDVVENQVVGYVPWPDAIPITQPDGEVPTDPTVVADHDKFAWRAEVGGVWEPVGITISYPTDEALASTSETPPTYVYVVMKHSGYEWASSITGDPANGLDPNLRDTIRPMTSQATESSLLVQVDVSQPNYPVDLFPTGPPIGGGLLGHNAGQPAFDPASDSVYVANMPSTSLPTTPAVPNDLTSFVSVVMLAPGELPTPGEVPSPVTVTVLCGPEHPDIALLAGVPQSWACIAEGGEGPFQWTFTNLPGWLTAHIDPISGQGDGILYGTPPPGNYTFQAHVDDYATTPPGTGDATISLIVTADPATEYEYGELEWEVGVPAAVAIEGTPKAGGDPCALTPTLSPGSIVPSWVDVIQISGRTIDNTAVGGPVENTIGCVVMGTPPISGERYEFQMPNLQFTWPSQALPLVISGQVLGPYTFDPLPTGVGLSGLAWHQIDKIHDASTEADLLNREFFGVEPYTGQMYRIVAPYAGLEAEGTIVPPPALEGELDEVEPYAEVLTPLIAARPDIAAALAANPNLKIRFGDVAVEANPNAQVFVTANEISDSTGVDPTVIPIGGPAGSSIPVGTLIKVSGTRDPQDPAALTFSTASAIDLPGVQGYYLGLDSDLAPAVPGEPGQHDNGVLWVTGTSTGNVATIDTLTGTYTQLLTISGATSLGGVSVYPTTRVAYVATPGLNSVTIFGPGDAPSTAPVIWSASTTTFKVGSGGSFKVMATGSPTPALSEAGALPSGVTFIDNLNGTATLAGTPAVGAEGSYPFTITATNGVSPDATQEFTLTVNVGTAPAITSANATTFTVGTAGSFTVTATGSPVPSLSAGTLPDGVTFTDNGNGTATLAGTLAAGSQASYLFTITAANGVLPNATQDFTLTVNNPPFGWMDWARDQNDSDTTLTQGGMLHVLGWAADTDSGAPVSQVEVLIDGTPVGNATLGLVRMDVAEYFGRPDYANSGWALSYNIGSLAAGTHTVSAVAYDGSGGSANLLGSQSINVTAENTAPFGWMDWARDQNDGDSTLPQGGTLDVLGWAVDANSNPGAPVSRVEVLIDGAVIGYATLGLVRPDVASAFNRADYSNSGWTGSYNVGELAVGTHTVSAVAYDASGLSATLLGSQSISISADNNPPFGWIDWARDQNDGDSTLLQGGTLHVLGWAADAEYPGAPVSRVEVRIDGTPIGNATLGLTRPDVASAFNRADYTYSGWTFSYNIGGLAVGTHTVSAVAYDGSGGSANLFVPLSISVVAQ